MYGLEFKLDKSMHWLKTNMIALILTYCIFAWILYKSTENEVTISRPSNFLTLKSINSKIFELYFWILF